MKIKQCMGCKGAKKVIGMGFMTLEDCRVCKGIGHVPDIEDIEVDAILQKEPSTLLVEDMVEKVDAAPVSAVKKAPVSKPKSKTVAKKKS